MNDLAQKWNPLEDGPMAEVIPPQWTGPHTGKRLAEAFNTLAIVPVKSIGAGSSCWPDYVREEMPKAEEGRARARASAADISRMEQAIVWPGRYLGGDPAMMRIVQLIAITRAFGSDEDDVLRRQERLCRRRGWYLPTILRKNRRGLQLIADGLNRDGVIPW